LSGILALGFLTGKYANIENSEGLQLFASAGRIRIVAGMIVFY
jgi:hypothetical protein